MKSFYPKGNWVKWKSRIEESVESLIKWAFEKTVNKSWQNRWDSSFHFQEMSKTSESKGSGVFCVYVLVHLLWIGRTARKGNVDSPSPRIYNISQEITPAWKGKQIE